MISTFQLHCPQSVTHTHHETKVVNGTIKISKKEENVFSMRTNWWTHGETKYVWDMWKFSWINGSKNNENMKVSTKTTTLNVSFSSHFRYLRLSTRFLRFHLPLSLSFIGFLPLPFNTFPLYLFHSLHDSSSHSTPIAKATPRLFVFLHR